MKSVKLMMVGIMMVAMAAWFAAMDGRTGSIFGGMSLIFGFNGIVVFLVGLFRNNDR